VSTSTSSSSRAGNRLIPSGSIAVLAGALVLPAVGIHAGGVPEPPSKAVDAWQSSFRVATTNLASSGSNPYFVLEPGYRLHFKHADETLTVSVLDETKLVDGVETRVVEEREEKHGQLTEVSRNYFAIDRTTGDVYYFGEDSDEYRHGRVVSREGSWLAGEDGARFGLMMPGTAKVGARFYQELAPNVAMDRAEIVAVDSEVSVPAGTFTSCVQVKETSPLENGSSRKIYAPGVGLIQDDEFILARIEAAPTRDAAPQTGFDGTSIALPGAPPEGILLDYLVVDHARHRVWVPAGGTGSTDVIDTQTLDLRRVENFPTAEVERRGAKRRVGPSSATVGDGVVYVGNRGDSSVCAVDAETLVRGACVTLPSMPDGVAFVASSKEVWVTTPRDQSIVILDVSDPTAPKIAGRIEFEGDPEGYAVDNARGFFYTNLEDKDRTLRIDVSTRAVTATWMPECGDAGPRCLLIDPSGQLLVVACTDHVEVLDAGNDGAILSKLETGGGVDSFDYLPARRSLYVAAAHAATLTVAHLDESGGLKSTAVIPTALGARNAVVTADGNVFIAVGPEGRILRIGPSSVQSP